jgi:hypothetical protein
MVEGLSEILEKINKLKKGDRAAELKKHDSFAMRTILQGALDERIKFLLPPGTPPYKPSEMLDNQNVLKHDARKLVYFVEGGAPNLRQSKREMIFIELLESVARKDAELLIAVKDKKFPYKGITKEIVKEAFPGLIP